MRTIRPLFLLSCILFLLPLSHAECIKDHRLNKVSGWLVTDLSIVGTRTLSSEELASISGDMVGSCFNDNSGEIEERIRNSFQERGYFTASAKNVRISGHDPMSVPKPVAIEAEVSEGPRCKFGEIRFTGNHAFPDEKLLAEFPVKKGDLYQRRKVASGLEKVRDIYLMNGNVDITMVPASRIVGDRMTLTIDVEEGSQFRMGKLLVFANPEQADKLRAAWGLQEGAVFDFSYPEKYINDNSSLLPANVTRRFGQIARNCRESTVEVRLPIDPFDPRSQVRAKDIDCESQDARAQH